MTRSAVVLDRIVVLLAGVVLVAFGVAMFVWPTNWVAHLPKTLDAAPLAAATGAGWWPWAQAAVGLVLVVLAVRWLLAHTPSPKITALRLSTGAESSDTVTANLESLADAAAATLKESSMVQSASGKAIVDRGIRTVVLAATVHHAGDAAAVVDRVDAVCAQVAHMVGDDTIATRATVHVARKAGRTRRVAAPI